MVFTRKNKHEEEAKQLSLAGALQASATRQERRQRRNKAQEEAATENTKEGKKRTEKMTNGEENKKSFEQQRKEFKKELNNLKAGLSKEEGSSNIVESASAASKRGKRNKQTTNESATSKRGKKRSNNGGGSASSVYSRLSYNSSRKSGGSQRGTMSFTSNIKRNRYEGRKTYGRRGRTYGGRGGKGGRGFEHNERSQVDKIEREKRKQAFLKRLAQNRDDEDGDKEEKGGERSKGKPMKAPSKHRENDSDEDSKPVSHLHLRSSDKSGSESSSLSGSESESDSTSGSSSESETSEEEGKEQLEFDHEIDLEELLYSEKFWDEYDWTLYYGMPGHPKSEKEARRFVRIRKREARQRVAERTALEEARKAKEEKNSSPNSKSKKEKEREYQGDGWLDENNEETSENEENKKRKDDNEKTTEGKGPKEKARSKEDEKREDENESLQEGKEKQDKDDEENTGGKKRIQPSRNAKKSDATVISAGTNVIKNGTKKKQSKVNKNTERNGDRNKETPANREPLTGNNNQTASSSSTPDTTSEKRKHFFFYNLKIDLQKHLQPVEELRNKLTTFLALLKQVDSTVVICEHDTNSYKGAITKAEDIPHTVGEMRKYFNRIFPVPKGGATYPGVRIGLNGSREKIQDFTEYDLRARGIHMWYRTIQSRSIVKGFYLQNFSPDADLKFWADFFERRMHEMAKEEKYASNSPQAAIKIGLKCHPLNDGKRKAKTATTWAARRNLAVHVEFEESMEELGSEFLTKILKGLEFASMYGASVRLTPTINRKQTEPTKERIRRCQAMHKVTIYNMENASKTGIEVLDERSKEIGLTLRQLIMQQKGKEGQRLFISVARSVYGNSVIFTYPKIYASEAHTRMAAIGQYLEKEYGPTVRQFFTIEERERMKRTSWDDNGEPLFSEDKMLDDILEQTKEAWVIEELPTEIERPEKEGEGAENTKANLPPHDDKPASNNYSPNETQPPPFVGDPDADSLPSWGSGLHRNILNDDAQSTGTAGAFDAASKSGQSQGSRLSRSTPTSGSVSQLTTDSRMSAMERSLATQQQKLDNVNNNMCNLVNLMEVMKKSFEPPTATHGKAMEKENKEKKGKRKSIIGETASEEKEGGNSRDKEKEEGKRQAGDAAEARRTTSQK